MWHTPREKDHYVQVGSRRRSERVYIPKLTAKIQSAQGVEKVEEYAPNVKDLRFL